MILIYPIFIITLVYYLHLKKNLSSIDSMRLLLKYIRRTYYLILATIVCFIADVQIDASALLFSLYIVLFLLDAIVLIELLVRFMHSYLVANTIAKNAE